MKINAGWQTLDLDNTCSGGFSICRNRISICKGTKHSEHQMVMRGELRGEIFACKEVCGRTLLQVKRGIVIEEGKIGAASPAWGSVGRLS